MMPKFDNLFNPEKQHQQLQELEKKLWNESVENRTCPSCKYYKLKKEWEMGYKTAYGWCNFGGQLTYPTKPCLFYELMDKKTVKEK